MNVEITNLYGLICIPFIAVFLWWTIKKQKGTVLKASVIISRVLLCSLLVGALCGLQVKLLGKNSATIFLLDVSDSMRDFREDGTKFIEEAVKELPKNHKAGVIVFGEETRMDKFLDENKHYSKIGTVPVTSATNIEQALQTALVYMPEEANKEIILLSDGQENEGDMLKAVELLKGENVDFKVYKVGHRHQDEVYIDKLTVPERTYKGESFSVITTVMSNVKTKAKLTLFSGSEKKSEQEVDLEVGENSFVFKDIQETGGFKSYKAMITCSEDQEVGNNEYSCFTTVQDVPQILLVQGKEGEVAGIENVLGQMGANQKKVLPIDAPNTLEGMLAYKAIVLSNVYITDLPKGFLEQIDGYVKNYGGGLVVTGGEDAYALGGYEETVLEKMLPVDMHKKGEMNIADTSLCLVIDHSGSMSDTSSGATKLGMSIEAAANVVDFLSEEDEISVYSFDDTYTEVVKRQKVTDKENIKGLIYGIHEGGGTSIYPALEAAYKEQCKSTADIKHIILLTDGEDTFSANQYSGLVEDIKNAKITLSTVAVGDGANNALLSGLAKKGNGRNYVAKDVANLPRIFAKEFFMSTGEYLINETFTPKVVNSHEILKGLGEEGFLLNGYIGTSMKPLATEVLTSHHGEPVLALWQYGLGKTVAWTSDVSGQWSGPLFETDKGLQLFKNILSWSMTTYEGDGEMKVTEAGEGVKVSFTAADMEATKDVEVYYESETGEQKKQKLTEVSPGVYEGEVPLEENGFYAINTTETLKDGTSAQYVSAFAKQYSKEYKFNENDEKLGQLIEAVNGKLITDPGQVFKLNSRPSYKTMDLTTFLLLIACVLFMMDIIARRFQLSFCEVFGIRKGHKKSEAKKRSILVEQLHRKRTRNITQNTQSGEVVDKQETQERVMKEEVKVKAKATKEEANKVKPQKEKKQKKEKVQESALDTASLLKSKKDRNA